MEKDLQEALELFLECASETEIQERLHREVFHYQFGGCGWVS
jgi:hypothetical protein